MQSVVPQKKYPMRKNISAWYHKITILKEIGGQDLSRQILSIYQDRLIAMSVFHFGRITESKFFNTKEKNITPETGQVFTIHSHFFAGAGASQA